MGLVQVLAGSQQGSRCKVCEWMLSFTVDGYIIQHQKQHPRLLGRCKFVSNRVIEAFNTLANNARSVAVSGTALDDKTDWTTNLTHSNRFIWEGLSKLIFPVMKTTNSGM